MATPRRRLTFGAGRLAPVSTAITKSTASASRPLPDWVQKIQNHYQQTRQRYQAMISEEDTEMTDSVQTRVSRLDQEIQNLINCCNNEREVIEIEFDDVKRDCEIFAQQVETNTILGVQVLEGHDQQIRALDFVLREARTGIDAIQEQSQQIIAGATEEFNKLKERIQICETEQTQIKVHQTALKISYSAMSKRVSEMENFIKKSVPNFEDLPVVTDRVNEISNQTTGLTEAVAGAKFSATTPERRGRVERVRQWQARTEERNRSISPLSDSDVALQTGLRGGSGTDVGMQDPQPGPSGNREPTPPPRSTRRDPTPPRRLGEANSTTKKYKERTNSTTKKEYRRRSTTVGPS